MLPIGGVSPHLPFLIPMLMLPLLGIATIVVILPYWFIFKKAGFSPWLCILMFVPLVNLIVLYIVAFSEWKVIPAPYGYQAAPPPPPYSPRA